MASCWIIRSGPCTAYTEQQRLHSSFKIHESNLGKASNINLSILESQRPSSGNLHPLYGIRPWARQDALPFTGLALSRRCTNPLIVRCASPSEVQSATKLEHELEETQTVAPKTQLVPNSFEVESLLTEICDSASIAEFELKFGGFRLYVTRDLAGKHKPSPSPTPSPVSTNMTVQSPASNGSVSAHSLAISKPTPSGESRTSLEKSADEGLVVMKSPRVGFFRRSRMIKGKRAPPPCKENQIVKEGQVLCFIEQLGGLIPIESDVAGEVVKILLKDGEPVGYGDAIMEILPSFPGIKKLQN